MTQRIRYFAIVGFTALALGFAGCKKETPPPPPPPAPAPAPAPKVEAPAPAPVSVAGITLGKAIGADKKVTSASDTFAKADTIYASVDTTGTGTATLKAKWTFHKGDKSADVSEETATIAATGPATSEFHISKPSGWPPGDYQVAITLGDKPAGTKKFTVK